ncbi:MAG TPA: ABC transporter substrate-binding protein [Blastocatellia bacterium]|nr:ABC transporter substrate-binding protein [Blastocatellia bacterium]
MRSGLRWKIIYTAAILSAVVWLAASSGLGGQTSGAGRPAQDRNSGPGAGPEVIKLGAALPMTGPLSRIGVDVKSALAACFDEISSRGGINGRRIELVVEDSRGEAAGTDEATRRLVEERGVFALVGSFEPKGSASTNEYLRRSGVPLVGPVTLSPAATSAANRYVFYLLPGFSDQARVLVDFIGAKGTISRIAVVYTIGEFDQDALTAVKAQAKLYTMSVVAEQRYNAGALSSPALLQMLVEARPDCILFFGIAADFLAFGEEMERAKLQAVLMSSAVMVGRGAFRLPPGMAVRTFLSFPSSLPGREDFAPFLGLMQKRGVPLRSAAFQSVAYAAAAIMAEGIRQAGKQLSRDGLVNALEQLRGFKTGVIPPVSFGPNRRVGAAGSYVVGIDLENKQYLPLSDRLVPR